MGSDDLCIIPEEFCPGFQGAHSLRSGLTWSGQLVGLAGVRPTEAPSKPSRTEPTSSGRLCAPRPLGVALYACLNLRAAVRSLDQLNPYKTLRQKQGPVPQQPRATRCTDPCWSRLRASELSGFRTAGQCKVFRAFGPTGFCCCLPSLEVFWG